MISVCYISVKRIVESHTMYHEDVKSDRDTCFLQIVTYFRDVADWIVRPRK